MLEYFTPQTPPDQHDRVFAESNTFFGYDQCNVAGRDSRYLAVDRGGREGKLVLKRTAAHGASHHNEGPNGEGEKGRKKQNLPYWALAHH